MSPSPTRAASPRPRWRSLVAAVGMSACLALVAAACGDEDSGQIPQTGNVSSSESSTTSESTTTTSEPTTTTAPPGAGTESSTTTSTSSTTSTTAAGG